MAAVVTPQEPQSPVVAPVQPVVETPNPVPEPTVREHAEATQPDRQRRRAPADDARPEEHEDIQSLTKRLRDAEEASGIKRKPNESNRVYDLRMRAELAERLRDAAKPAPVVERPKPLPSPIVAAPTDFSKPKPTLEQFRDTDDPAEAYFLALSAWDRERASHEATKARAGEDSQRAEAHYKQWWKDRDTEHVGRLQAYITANPAAKAEMEAFQDGVMTPLVYAAIITHPKSAELTHAFVKDPSLADELFLLTHGHQIGDPTSNPLVAIVQRKLLGKAQTVQLPERSPAPAWKPPTDPPTPVRTQPTAIAQPADDKESGGSIMSHAKKHWQKG